MLQFVVTIGLPVLNYREMIGGAYGSADR